MKKEEKQKAEHGSRLLFESSHIFIFTDIYSNRSLTRLTDRRDDVPCFNVSLSLEAVVQAYIFYQPRAVI